MSGVPYHSTGDVFAPGDWNVLADKLTSGNDSVNTGSVVAIDMVLGSIFASVGSFTGSIIGNSFMGTSFSGTNSNILTFNISNGSFVGSVVGNKLNFSNGSFTGSLVGVSADFTSNLNSDSHYATGSFIISGTTTKTLSPIGTGSPTIWGKILLAGSYAVSGTAAGAGTGSLPTNWYQLEANGTDAMGVTNLAENGTINYISTGFFNSGVGWNASTSNYLSTVAFPTGYTGLSIALWLYPSTVNGMIFAQSNGGDGQCWLQFRNGSVVNIAENGGNEDFFAGLTPGSWHHVVATAVDSGFKYCYIDGTLVGSAGTTGFGTRVGSVFYGRNISNDNALSGTTDDIRIYVNYILTQADVNVLYNAGAGTNTSGGGTAGTTIGSWVVFGTGFSQIPIITTSHNASGQSLQVGSLTAGSMFVMGSISSSFNWMGVG